MVGRRRPESMIATRTPAPSASPKTAGPIEPAERQRDLALEAGRGPPRTPRSRRVAARSSPTDCEPAARGPACRRRASSQSLASSSRSGSVVDQPGDPVGQAPGGSSRSPRERPRSSRDERLDSRSPAASPQDRLEAASAAGSAASRSARPARAMTVASRARAAASSRSCRSNVPPPRRSRTSRTPTVPCVVDERRRQQRARDVAGRAPRRSGRSAGPGRRRRWPAAGRSRRHSRRCPRSRSMPSPTTSPSPGRRPRRRRAGPWPGRAGRSTTPARRARSPPSATTRVQQRLGRAGAARRSAASRRRRDRDERGEGGGAVAAGSSAPSPPRRRSRRAARQAARVGDDQVVALEAQQARPRRSRRAAGSPSGASRRSCPPAPPGCTARAGGSRPAAGRRSSSGSPLCRASSRRRCRARRPGRSRKWRSSTWAVSRRISAASAARSARRRAGCSSTRRSNASRRRTWVSTASMATAVAERGAPSSRASSPKNPPGPMVVRMAGSEPSSGGQGDLDLALGDDEQGVARVAGMEDGLAPPEASRAEGGGHQAQGRVVEPANSRHARRAAIAASAGIPECTDHGPMVRGRRGARARRLATVAVARLGAAWTWSSARAAGRRTRRSSGCAGSAGRHSHQPRPSPARRAARRTRSLPAVRVLRDHAPRAALLPRRRRRRPPSPTQLGASEVRKPATFIFVDLKGSTALTERIDQEAMSEIKRRYFTVMAAQIERHGGTIEKYIGDAIMAVFGIPRAHEDDALRAVRAAHGMQQELAGLNEDFQRFYGVELAEPDRRQHRRGRGQHRPERQPAAGHRRHGQRRRPARAGGAGERDPHRRDDLRPRPRARRGRGGRAARAQGQVRARAGLPAAPRPRRRRGRTRRGTLQEAPLVGREAELATPARPPVRHDRGGQRCQRRPPSSATRASARPGWSRDFTTRRWPTRPGSCAAGACRTATASPSGRWPRSPARRPASRRGRHPGARLAARSSTLLAAGRRRRRRRSPSGWRRRSGLSAASFPVTELFWGGAALPRDAGHDRAALVVIDDLHWAAADVPRVHRAPRRRRRRVAPILLLADGPRTRCSRAGRTGAQRTAGPVIELGPAVGRARPAGIVDHLLGGTELDAVRATGSSPPPTATRCSSSRSCRCSSTRACSSASTAAGSRPSEIADLTVPPTIQALLAVAARRPVARGAGRRRAGVGHRRRRSSSRRSRRWCPSPVRPPSRAT